MAQPIDTARFPTGAPDVTYDDPEDAAGFAAMLADVRKHLEHVETLPIVETLILAFGITPIIGLYLARLVCPIAEGVARGQQEVWAVVGDLPFLCFGAANASAPAGALEVYCEIAQDWADKVLAGEDLSESYPIPVAPTQEHAEMLLSRIEFIRKKLIPLA